MPQVDTAAKVLQFIHQYSKPELFEELPLLISNAFRLAEKDCSDRIVHCDLRKSRKRSQDRYFYVQEAMCESQSGWNVVTRTTKNGGESYTQLATQSMLATVHVPPWFNGKLRRAGYRDENAKFNAGITEQMTLLKDEEEAAEEWFDKLNILVVAQAPSPDKPQDEPAIIQVLVPHENNNAYHLIISLDDLLTGYEKVDTSYEPVDQAWPKLRDVMRQVEEGGEQDEDDE